MTKKPRRVAAQAKKAARQAEIERQAAIRAEEIAEAQAPRIQRIAIADADGVVLREPLAEHDTRRGGYRRSCPLRRMHAQGQVEARHVTAAERFSQDYEVGLCGAVTARDDGMRVSGATHVGISEMALIAAGRYRAACDQMGAHRQMVQWVALHRWPITQVMQVAGIGHARAMRTLLAGLDALADFYVPHRAAASPAREPDVIDPSVTDVPQERLGRVAA